MTKLSHIHLQVRNIRKAAEWFERVLQITPRFYTPKSASVGLGAISVDLDSSKYDSRATLAFSTSDCDKLYRQALKRGARGISKPADMPWGVRAAYLKGPAGLVIEFNGPLKKKSARV